MKFQNQGPMFKISARGITLIYALELESDYCALNNSVLIPALLKVSFKHSKIVKDTTALWDLIKLINICA